MGIPNKNMPRSSLSLRFNNSLAMVFFSTSSTRLALDFCASRCFVGVTLDASMTCDNVERSRSSAVLEL